MIICRLKGKEPASKVSDPYELIWKFLIRYKVWRRVHTLIGKFKLLWGPLILCTLFFIMCPLFCTIFGLWNYKIRAPTVVNFTVKCCKICSLLIFDFNQFRKIFIFCVARRRFFSLVAHWSVEFLRKFRKREMFSECQSLSVSIEQTWKDQNKSYSSAVQTDRQRI